MTLSPSRYIAQRSESEPLSYRCDSDYYNDYNLLSQIYNYNEDGYGGMGGAVGGMHGSNTDPIIRRPDSRPITASTLSGLI